MEPSDLDKRAAKEFQELANVSGFFPVTCRFRRVIRVDERVEHGFWPTGAEEFKKHFGNAASYFAGAFEYIRLATGWRYPYPGLYVRVFNCKGETSGAIYPPGIRGTRDGEACVFWAKGEFTLTVLHELVHLFKKGSDEDWVEQQALKLTMGV